MTQPAQSNGNGAKPRQEMISGTYLRNAWYVAAWSDDVGDGQLVPRTIMDEPIVLYRKANGDVAAIEDRCAHRFAPLSMGKIVGGDRIQCPYHGLEYDAHRRLRAQSARHQEHSAAGAGEKLSRRSRSTRRCGSGWAISRPTNARFPTSACSTTCRSCTPPSATASSSRPIIELIIDNLLDLSHTSYLHEGILGNADTVESEIKVEQDGDDVVVGRHATNSAPPGMFAQFWPDHPAKVDKFTNMRWMAPSTLRLFTGICKMGAEPDTGTGYHAVHLLTPETDRSTHYFFTAVRCGVRTPDDKLNRDLQEKDRRDAALCFRGAGRAGDRGAAAGDRSGRRTARSGDPRRSTSAPCATSASSARCWKPSSADLTRFWLPPPPLPGRREMLSFW